MSNFPNEIDSDEQLPPVNDNITEVGGEAINAIRDAVFNIENEIGVGASGSTGSIANRLATSFNADGSIKSSVLTTAGLISLPIYDNHIAASAEIKESKLKLDYSTQNLYNQILSSKDDIATSLSFIADTGSKFEPHLDGYYRHKMSHVDVGSNFKNLKNLNRDNSNLFSVFNDLNNDYIKHQKSDGTDFGNNAPYLPNVGTTPVDNFAHNASGIHLNSQYFSSIPQSIVDLQTFAEFVDASSLLLLGTRIQTLYSNGITRSSRAGGLTNPLQNIEIIPTTKIKTFLLNNSASTPVDSIDDGDDLIEFLPEGTAASSGLFETQFSQIKTGDIITILYSDGYGKAPDGYGSSFVIEAKIKSKKPIVVSPSKKYIVRITNKNLFPGNFTASVYKNPVNTNKYGVLSTAHANAPSTLPSSLIIGNSRSAQTLGIGFEPDQIDESHYNLYLVLYPNGNPQTSAIPLPAIDVSGNKGKTPGAYTLDGIVNATNAAFRKEGYNYRFIAFSNKGEFGIMMSDPYNNCSFSIIAGVLASNGNYDNIISKNLYPANVVGVPGFDESDALGFSPSASASASPNYSFTSSGTAPTEIATVPTKIFYPSLRNNFLVNGVEKEKFKVEPFQILDMYGDAYWNAKIISKNVIPGVRVETTYEIQEDLSTSSLKIGKTLTTLSANNVDSGRFFIQNIQFNDCNCDGYGGITNITVYDSVHGTGSTPFSNAEIGSDVKIYFGSDSVSFNSGNISDLAAPSVSFKRLFEIYINEVGETFSHERARISLGATTSINSINLYGDVDLANFKIVSVSPKLKGYTYGTINKINLQIDNFNQKTGQYTGYLRSFDGTIYSNTGPTTNGKKGSIVRFYDRSNIDYIDVILDFDVVISTFSNKNIDIQLFPSLQLDEEIMVISNVEYNDTTKKISKIKDLRQFGNISEKNLSTSALDFISANNKHLDENGLIQGFDITYENGSAPGVLKISGGIALVNGKFIQMNPEIVNVPTLRESLVPYGGTNLTYEISWILCLNDKSEYEYVAFSDYTAETASTYMGASVNFDRTFYVYNPNQPSVPAYPVRSSTWSDLIKDKNNKDITPIAVITPLITIDGGTGRYVISNGDLEPAQRYISSGYGGLISPFVLGKSFKTMVPLTTWLQKINNFYKNSINGTNSISNEVYVCDDVVVSSFPQLARKVKFIGSGGKIIINSAANLGSNYHFENMIFDINSQIGLNFSGSSMDVSFSDCIFNYNYDPIVDYNSSLLNNPNGGIIYCLNEEQINKNINILNSKFNFLYQEHHPAIAFNCNSEAYLENINIVGNTFTNYANTNDKKSVISFVNDNMSTPTSIGVRLVNLNIKDNICDTNQLILISSARDGNNKVNDMFVPIGVNIDNNICGAINYLVRQDLPSQDPQANKILDKGSIIKIINNKCNYIYCGYADGFIDQSNVSNNTVIHNIIQNQNIFSASAFIHANVCSWIHLCVKSPSLNSGHDCYDPYVLVVDNVMKSKNPSYLSSYWKSGSYFNDGVNVIPWNGD